MRTEEIPVKLLRLPEVLELIGIPRASFYRLRKQNGFPPAVKIGERIRAWRLDEIIQWIENRQRESIQSPQSSP